MDRRMIVEFIILIAKFGMIVAGLLFFFSFNGFMKDVDRRIIVAEHKENKHK